MKPTVAATSTPSALTHDADDIADRLETGDLTIAGASLQNGQATFDIGAAADPAAPAEPAALPMSGIDATGRPWKRVLFDNPLKRAGAEVTNAIVRKPMGGDLRGAKLVDVYNMDVVAMSQIIPRLTEPTIHRPEFMAMDGEDIASLSSEVVNFLLTRSQKVEAGLNA